MSDDAIINGDINISEYNISAQRLQNMLMEEMDKLEMGLPVFIGTPTAFMLWPKGKDPETGERLFDKIIYVTYQNGEVLPEGHPSIMPAGVHTFDSLRKLTIKKIIEDFISSGKDIIILRIGLECRATEDFNHKDNFITVRTRVAFV